MVAREIVIEPVAFRSVAHQSRRDAPLIFRVFVGDEWFAIGVPAFACQLEAAYG